VTGRVRTLKELADKLDISVATVSRALAGHERIAKATRERVAEAARRYGYVPNRTARALVSGRSGFVGLALPARTAGEVDPFLGEFVCGLSRGLARHGADLFLAAVPEGADELSVLTHIVEGRRADGLVLARTAEEDARVAYLAGAGIPFVTHGRVARPPPGHSWIDTDGAAAFAEAFERLYALGHRRLGLATIAEPMMFRRLREQGLAAAIARRGDPAVTLTTATAPRFDRAARVESLRALLARPDRPTAIIGLFDGLAVAAIEAALALGLSVPRDVSVIGFDNTAVSAHTSPALTTFDAAIDAAAGQAADMLAEIMAAPPVAPLTRLVRPRFVERASHGPAPPAT
jgi:LacI family transcriptional regulator